MNICTLDNYDKFVDRIKHGGIDKTSRVSLVLSCVDNYAARTTIN
jgi:ubiquitin-like modifier-activating enzyme 5